METTARCGRLGRRRDGVSGPVNGQDDWAVEMTGAVALPNPQRFMWPKPPTPGTEK